MNIVFFTGAGISAESGVRTFRDSDGLWHNYRIEDVATPEAWHRHPERVLDFYNQRRRQLYEVEPNTAHQAISALQEHFEVQVITQNVDDLHERAGNRRVLHLHGELRKVRSVEHPELVYPWEGNLHLGDTCERGAQLRPHIVWFGEAVPLMKEAEDLTRRADILVVVGTSLQVYPAAGLLHCAAPGTPVYYIDPNPNAQTCLSNLTVITKPASEALPILANKLLEQRG